ncbi:MAG: biotin--[acetyl-CoA-carboxylase] ligase [Methanosarcinaceae archaeon]|nr:biotin--[acetyl-CoA-carboxylase] ligase [Methanosarcinaceae archaeon]MDD4330763.1 biotin--[acetyl-CoA-carboxylase] ligase [Methanosarcinaceae archaeon]MDD4748534.1 biotin--[acetyl-CoA-carboxylase] ligase [Methanosarcinaceae archaeon]
MGDKRSQIIKALKESKGAPVSGEELGLSLGVSRTMIWKYIKSLQAAGYEIDSSPKKGYILKAVPQLLYPEEVQMGLKTTLLGKKIHYFEELSSTNNTAKQIALSEEEGTLVIAEIQKGGRGRLGREWVSPLGGIWVSIILKPGVPLRHASRLTLVAGLAVANVMRDLGLDARIKWPNDVRILERKVCGILTEAKAEVDRVDYVILGIGINVNMDLKDIPEPLREGSTTLKVELGKHVGRVAFLQDLLFELEQQYIRFKTQPFSQILNDWMALSDTIGREVKVTTPSRIIEGKAVGVTSDGALVVKKADKTTEEVIAGRCIYARTK